MKIPAWRVWVEDKAKLNQSFKSYFKKGLLIKVKISSNLLSSHLNKAYHNLDLATFIFEKQDKISTRDQGETYNDSVIVFAYYSMYHAALSLLYSRGIRSKSHSATICYLCKECRELDEDDIEKIASLLDKKNIEEIGEGQQRRERASYSSSIDFNKKLAELTLEDARDFVNKIRGILKKT